MTITFVVAAIALAAGIAVGYITGFVRGVNETRASFYNIDALFDRSKKPPKKKQRKKT